jgi:hypothetical protein
MTAENDRNPTNRFYAHAEAGEPAAKLNDYDPANPFAVIYFGDGWDFTSTDPDWCRRVAAARTKAADLLDVSRTGQPGGQTRQPEIEFSPDWENAGRIKTGRACRSYRTGLSPWLSQLAHSRRRSAPLL